VDYVKNTIENVIAVEWADSTIAREGWDGKGDRIKKVLYAK